MRRSLPWCAALTGVLAALAVPAAAQRSDEKKVAECEKKVSGLEARVASQHDGLRLTYRDIERGIAAARKEDDGGKLRAEIARVLEPALGEVRKLSEKPTPQNRARAVVLAKKACQDAMRRLELAPLPLLADYLAERIQAALADPASVFETLQGGDLPLAQAALEAVLDESKPFHVRWNDHLAASLGLAGAYRKSVQELDQAKTDLAIAKDPLLAFRIGAPEGYARVPAGNYTTAFTAGFVGKDARKKSKPHVVARDFFLALHEVTVAEYLSWLETLPDDQRKVHEPKDQQGKAVWSIDPATGRLAPPPDTGNHPITGIPFPSAVAYAASKGARLPTEEEWSAAAGGEEARVYPWGAAWEPNRCNDSEAGSAGPQPVGTYPGGRGPFGHFDLAGNASEWVATYESGKPVDTTKIETANVVVRGGSFRSAKKDVVVGWVWIRHARGDQDEETGFRLAKDPDAK